MLVLSRRIDESIVIDGEITITVLGVDRNGQVRLGIDAPARYRVMRQELLDEVRSENASALASLRSVEHLAALEFLDADQADPPATDAGDSSTTSPDQPTG